MESLEKVPVKSFSIFDPSIRFDHKEFYEKIIGELNGIFPVCNQGESMAVDISDNATEQEQITELMKRMENFSRELLDVTKKLFDQYYVAKEALHHSILTTTSYNKINTLDRNLLERTCDVRWWALETAFSDCIGYYDQVRKEAVFLVTMLKQEITTQTNSDELSTTGQNPFDELYEMEDKGPTPDYIIKVLSHFHLLLGFGRLEAFTKQFEDPAAIGMTNNQKLIKSYTGFAQSLKQLQKLISFACDRLEDIRASYTLYRDLVITSADGFIIANSNTQRRPSVLGLCVDSELWFKNALQTKCGADYCAQDLSPSVVEDTLSLVYSTAVRENSNENGNAIGTMGVFFDFQGEASIILEEYMPRDQRAMIVDGCYSMFTNKDNCIIASNDQDILEIGKNAHIPRRNRTLERGEKVGSYLVFEGADSAVFSAKTDGYLEYEGLEWCSHVIIPKDLIFNADYSQSHDSVSIDNLMNSKIIPEINKNTYLKVQDDKESIQLISLNGIVFASKLGKRGASLGPIFNQITQSGDFVTSRMEDLLKEMAVGELCLNLKALENFSKQAVDLIDRNLFERSADIRWWATDQYLWQALMNPSEKNFIRAAERLKVINSSYTMYRNIILSNSSGDIVACSHNELRNELAKINVSDHLWFQNGMRSGHSTEYAVQDVAKSPLERSREQSLIYSGGVRKDGVRSGDSIGVLGILFDWDTEAQKILSVCLPRDNDGHIVEGAIAYYANRKNEVIETTSPEELPVGTKMCFDKRIADLHSGETSSGIFNYNNREYIIGSSRTKGYREYEGLEWSAHVMRPLY